MCEQGRGGGRPGDKFWSWFSIFLLYMGSGNELRSSGHAANAFGPSCWPHGELTFVTKNSVFSTVLQILRWEDIRSSNTSHLERARLFTKEACGPLISLNPTNQTVRGMIHSPPAALIHPHATQQMRKIGAETQPAGNRQAARLVGTQLS